MTIMISFLCISWRLVTADQINGCNNHKSCFLLPSFPDSSFHPTSNNSFESSYLHQDIRALPRTTDSKLNQLISTNNMATMAVPATCCGREGGCICAKEATCSCGKQPAMHCTCEKSETENMTTGARCSCSRFFTLIFERVQSS